jgi:CelD/BcsL family acetyltransferase involved in cellulose biosynthesis
MSAPGAPAGMLMTGLLPDGPPRAAGRVTLRRVTSEQDAVWGAAAAHPMGGLFSSAPWTRAVARTYGFEVSATVRNADGAGADAALLFARVSDLRGERIVCGPFSDYCDPLAGDAEAWRELVAPLLAMRLPVTLRCLRSSWPAQDARFTVSGRAAWHGVDLDRTEEDIWHGLDGPARRDVRKAQRLGVTIREGSTIEELKAFFDMHCQVRKTKYRLLPQPFAFFESLLGAFSPEGRLVVLLAEQDGAVVAGSVFLIWGDTLYYKFSASLDRRANPNDLIVWEGIRLGRSRGLRRFDFGASDYDQPGLVKFKRKFATEVGEIVRLRWLPPGHADQRAEQAGRLLSRMTHLLTDPAVPDPITRAAGEALYAQFC